MWGIQLNLLLNKTPNSFSVCLDTICPAGVVILDTSVSSGPEVGGNVIIAVFMMLSFNLLDSMYLTRLDIAALEEIVTPSMSSSVMSTNTSST